MSRNTTKPEHYNVSSNFDWLVFIICLCIPLIAGVFLGAVCGWEAGRRCGRNEVLRQAVESGYVEQVTTVNGDRGYRWKQ